MNFKIKIDRLALDGDGIGRLPTPNHQGNTALGGQAAFVPYALPDEVIDARLLVQKKNYSRWLPLRVETNSPARINPPCPYHFKPGSNGAWCGGCNWQMLDAVSQREAKRQLLIETLERLGGISKPLVTETVASPLDWRYRNKVQVPFGRRGDGFAAGFFAPGSHEIVEFDDCLVQTELSVRLVRFVKDYARKNRWQAYDEDEHRGWIRHLLVRTNEAGQALVAVITAFDAFPDKDRFIGAIRAEFTQVLGIHQNIQKAKTHVILGEHWKRLWGQEIISEEIRGLKISFGPGSFFQVNKPAAEILYGKAITELEINRDSVVLDVYCGVGALTLLAARMARLAVGVESVFSAIRDARRNAQANKITNVEFIAGEAERVLNELRYAPDRVLLDPPRSGCDEGVLRALLEIKPQRIVYVSCHPATLARDIKILSGDYMLLSATPVDLFPQTSHIETVARLELRQQ